MGLALALATVSLMEADRINGRLHFQASTGQYSIAALCEVRVDYLQVTRLPQGQHFRGGVAD
jgi:hypothetical protein